MGPTNMMGYQNQVLSFLVLECQFSSPWHLFAIAYSTKNDNRQINIRHIAQLQLKSPQHVVTLRQSPRRVFILRHFWSHHNHEAKLQATANMPQLNVINMPPVNVINQPSIVEFVGQELINLEATLTNSSTHGYILVTTPAVPDPFRRYVACGRTPPTF